MILNIMVGALSGAIVGGILYLLFKNKMNTTTLSVITVIITVLVIKLSNIYLTPYYEAWMFESKTKEVQIFKLISEQNPYDLKYLLIKLKIIL